MTLPAHVLDNVSVPAPVRVFAGYQIASVHGTVRVEVAVLRRESDSLAGAAEQPGAAGSSLRTNGEPQRVVADALILAAGMRPMRNIEGAITERDGVFFCQPQGEDRGEQPARAAAAGTCRLVLATLAASQPSTRNAAAR
jgi:hypothetical protein